MIDRLNNYFSGVPKLNLKNKVLYQIGSREIKDDLIQSIYDMLSCLINSNESKNTSHPPTQYYKNIITNNITYNININVNTSPPKKPKKDLLDIIIKIIKLITLFLGLSSLGDGDDDSSDNNLRLQLA